MTTLQLSGWPKSSFEHLTEKNIRTFGQHNLFQRSDGKWNSRLIHFYPFSPSLPIIFQSFNWEDVSLHDQINWCENHCRNRNSSPPKKILLLTDDLFNRDVECPLKLSFPRRKLDIVHLPGHDCPEWLKAIRGMCKMALMNFPLTGVETRSWAFSCLNIAVEALVFPGRIGVWAV